MRAIRDFLRIHITSFEQLEILLLIKSRPDKQWTVREAGEAAQFPNDVAHSALLHLVTARLLGATTDVPPLFFFAPATSELAQSVETLASAHQSNRAAIMAIMSTNAIERVRSGALRAFSDSFVLKKEPNGG